MSWSEEYKDCLDYIDNYWSRITFQPSRMRLQYRVNNLPILLSQMKLPELRIDVKRNQINANFIHLPHYYFVPNDNKFKYIFYWDSYFMFRGLMGTKREW